MFKGLSGKSAIVTGGATLIGAAVVRALHEAGVKVTLADIDIPRGQAVADSYGSGVWFSATDITDDAQVQACVEQAAARHGGVNFLVNLACTYVDDGINASRADWLTAMNVNVASAVMMLKAARPHLQKAGGRRGGQFHQHFVRCSPDRALVVPGKQGGAGAAHPQHGHGFSP